MDSYVTGMTIKTLREKRGITQTALGGLIGVSGKTVSKWETAKGLPDISLLQPLARALRVSVMELMNGRSVINQNRSSNMAQTKFYVCPVCGNVIHSIGNAPVSCCGITLPALEAEEADREHDLSVEAVEDEFFLASHHPMTKEHFLSFAAFVTTDCIQMVKFYPEGNAETRMQRRGHGTVYWYCNQRGLFKKKLSFPPCGKA